MIVSPMLPELRETFGVSTTTIGWSLTAYLLPFSILLLVSGTLGERWGRRRVVRATFLLYGLSCLGAAAAPNLGVFLAFRAAQGVGNAFTTPLLLAGLADITPPGRLGRAIGIYASFQAAGTSLAPFVGGIATEIHWRLGFLFLAAFALSLLPWPPPGEPRRHEEAPPVRPLFSGYLALLALAGMATTAGTLGMAYLVSLQARDTLGLSSGGAGVLLLTGGLAMLFLAPRWGHVVDRFGATRAGTVAVLVASGLSSMIGLVDQAIVLAVLWAATSATASLVLVAIQSLATSAIPDNRGGAISVVLAFRFAGLAMAPLIWIPVFETDPVRAFQGTALISLPAAVALVILGKRRVSA
ncbi:MAG: MFS transporter [Actinomycetia bacterium]|nr:MFS transporter [Actinomycetes bacterium]